MGSRAEHLQWCKDRPLIVLGMFEDTPAKMRHFIEGFN